MMKKYVGFGVPIDMWLRGPLREWAEENLGSMGFSHTEFYYPLQICKMGGLFLQNKENYKIIFRTS